MLIWALLLENPFSVWLSAVADEPDLICLQSVALALPLKRAQCLTSTTTPVFTRKQTERNRKDLPGVYSLVGFRCKMFWNWNVYSKLNIMQW
jgi:hypothetical protein